MFFFFKYKSFLTASLERATFFRDSLRAQLPLRYSGARRSDESPPPLSPTRNDDDNETNQGHSQNSNTSNENVPTNSLDSHENNEAQLDTCSSVHSNESVDQEAKNIMPDVELGSEESHAIESVFSDDDNDDASSSMNINPRPIILSAGETSFYENGVLKIKKIYGDEDDCEIVYVYGEQLKPRVPTFQIKINDIISKNIPFKENVSLHYNIFCTSIYKFYQ